MFMEWHIKFALFVMLYFMYKYIYVYIYICQNICKVNFDQNLDLIGNRGIFQLM